jgi:AcrR family transcriptional regulator
MPTKKRSKARASTRAGLDRETVIAGATELVDKHGLHALTLRSVAEHFGVKPPSLYNHVAGLDEIRRELALRGMRMLSQRFARVCAGKSADAAVRALAQAYRAFGQEHRGLYQAALTAPDPRDREASAAAAEAAEIVFAVLEGYGLSASELVHATRALRSAMHGFIAIEHAAGFGMPEDVEASYAALIELLIAGLQRQAAGRPETTKRHS